MIAQRSLLQKKIQQVGVLFFCLLPCLMQAQTPSLSPLLQPSVMLHKNMTLIDNPLKESGHILVFISSSMPAASLVQWFREANALGASLILRGFVNNSLLETKAWMKPLIEQVHQSGDAGGIEINPVAFEAYHITAVPAVVVTLGTIECTSNHDCIAPSFDVVIGNTSLRGALKIIAEQGEAGKLTAKAKLTQLKEGL